MNGWVVYGRPVTEMVTLRSTNPTLHDRESNSQPVDHKSAALTTTLPPHATILPHEAEMKLGKINK